MFKKLSFALAAVVTVLVGSGQQAHAQREYLAEEVEAYHARVMKPRFFQAQVSVMQNGSIMVSGQASHFQLFNRVKAVRCQPSMSGSTPIANVKSCTDSYFFGINESKSLPAGYYILGFENSIYPGFVKVAPGQETRIDLKRIDIPGNGVAKVFRNLTASVEQKKIYFTQFQMGKSFFSLAEYDFGDLYLRKFPLQDLMPNIEYSFCDSGWSQEMDPQASRLCRSYKSKRFMNMAEFFVFGSDSTHVAVVPRVPGAAFRYQLKRLLVSAPTFGSGNHVNVFPGEYVIETTVGSKSSRKSVSVSGSTSFGVE